MTSVSLRASRSRWLRAFLYGIFAEIATIVTIIAVMLIYRFGFARGLSDAAYEAFGQKAGGIIGVVAGTLFVYLFARALMRRLASDFIAHGVVVAVAAIALSVGGSIAGHHGVPAGYLLASALKLLAGGGAGWLAARRSPVMA